MSSQDLNATYSQQIAKVRAKARRSRDSQKSLSTIAEEPKSNETDRPESQPTCLEENQKMNSKQTTSQTSVQQLCKCQSPSKEQCKESAEKLETSPSIPSMLVKGFGLRNLASLQAALDREEKKLKDLYKAQERQQQIMSTSTLCSTETDNLLSKSLSSTSQEKVDTPCETQTEAHSITLTDRASTNRERLMYLMGLITEENEEENQISIEEHKKHSDKKKDYEAMRKAQRYLREHKIFEFFQYLIAHLLSALPANPIEFLIDLLNKCMIFRSGIPTPPLLYDTKHLEALFNLMDKMRTGYIDIEQYKTGMHTLGICTFNNKPPLTADNMVSKEFFIEEAYICLMQILNDMIQRHWPHRTIRKDLVMATPSMLFSSSEAEITTNRDNYILGTTV